MSKSTTAAAAPFALVRELREFAETQRAASAANAAYKAMQKRAQATVAAAPIIEGENSKGNPTVSQTVKIGATASITITRNPKDAPKFSESAAREAYAAALAAREALESGNAADALALLRTLPATLDPITHSDGRATYTVSL